MAVLAAYYNLFITEFNHYLKYLTLNFRWIAL